MEVFQTILQSLGMMIGFAAAVLVVFFVGSVFYIRSKVKGRVYCYLLAANKQLHGHLLKPQSYTVVLGSGETAGKFLLHPTKQFWGFWPPGFPRQLQEPIPTYLYCEGNSEPLDPWDRKALISPESLMKISDEAMLRQTWRDVKESLGLKGKFGSDNRLLLILVVAAIGAAGIAAYFGLMNAGQIADLVATLPGG